MTTVLLIRHGTTDWVEKHILHGITDIPLNETGLDQARKTAAALKGMDVSALYSSPLTRCVQTAEVIGKQVGLSPQLRDGIKELDFGWLEGRSFRDHSTQDFSPLVRHLDHHLHHFIRWVSGESISSLSKRVEREWQEILSENSGKIVLVVGHSAVFNAILIRHFGRNFPDGKTYYSMLPGSITEMRVTGQGAAELVRLSDTAHLV